MDEVVLDANEDDITQLNDVVYDYQTGEQVDPDIYAPTFIGFGVMGAVLLLSLGAASILRIFKASS